LWLGSSDAGVSEFDLTAEKPQRKRLAGDGHSSYVTSMVRCGNVLVTGGYDRRLVWWDLEAGTQIRSVAAHEKWIRDLAVTPDGRRVISVADDMQCRVWDVASGGQVAAFSDHAATTPHHYPSMLYAVAISADGRRIATGDRVGHVAIWDGETFEKVAELETPVMYTWDPKQRRHSIGGIRSLGFSPEGRRLAVGGIGKIGNIDHLGGPARLEVFDWESGERQLELEDQKKKGLIEQINWSPDGKWIMTVGGDHNGFLTVYDSATGEILHQDGKGGHVHAAAHDRNFQHVFLAAHGRVGHWSASAQEA
jgi:WD40 repeat protein